MANFVVSGTPHVRSKESIQSIMRDVIIALVPATAAGIYYFGLRALILIVAAIISAVFFEWLYEKITKKPVTINDLSAVVTGLLLAMNLPASAPVWVAIVGVHLPSSLQNNCLAVWARTSSTLHWQVVHSCWLPTPQK